MSVMHCRTLMPEEVEAAYRLVMDAASWLEERQLPAWRVPRDLYEQRQHSCENHGLFVREQLCAVVTLTLRLPEAWCELITHRKAMWLASLARVQTPVHRQCGRILMEYAEQHAIDAGCAALYLDCYYGDGRLPQYYERVGYGQIVRQSFMFEDGSVHDSVLMRRLLDGS